MANDYKNVGQGSLKFEDGKTVTPNSLTLVGIKGGVSFRSRRERQPVMSRNEPIAWAKSKGEISEISFEVHYREWKSRTTAPADGSGSSIRDFLLGNFTDAVSVGDGGEFEFKMTLTVADSGATGDEAEDFVWTNCVLEETSFSEDEDTNTLSFTIKSLDVEPTVTRS